MSLAMAPLVVLFELSILLARWIGRIKPVEDRAGRWDDDDEDDDDGDDEPDDDGPPAGEPDGFDDEDDDGPDGRYDEDDDEPHLGIRAGDPDGLRGDLTKLGGPDRKD
jgi:hypothetical protein